MPLVVPLSPLVECVGILKDAYSRSNGYLNQLAQYAGQMPERMDWKSASEGIGSVNNQLRELFAQHLGKIISKVRGHLCWSRMLMIDGLWEYVEEGTITQRCEGEDREGKR